MLRCTFLVALFLSPAGFAGDLTPEQKEELGIEHGGQPVQVGPAKNLIATGGTVLLIPDSSGDDIGMFDPFDGTFLGIFADGTGTFSTPINAIQGPDGNIYLSDQVADSVFVFDPSGTFLFTYADGTDGLDNIRGIDFRNGHLFVTSGDDYVAEFSGPHTRLPDFIPPTAGVDSFDVLFLADGSCLVADIGPTDEVSQFKADGSLDHSIFAVDFPEQVAVDPLNPGDFLTAGFTDKWVTHHDLVAVKGTTPLASSGRGVYRLGNGNLLVTNSSGVHELQPGTGAVLSTKATGSGWRFIEEVQLGAWTDLGFALPGSLGAPVLTGDGALAAGNTVTIALSNALPNTTAHLILGIQNLSVKFYGGTLVPSPNIVLPVPIGPTGGLSVFTTFPAGVPAGLSIYVQYWIQDPSGVFGLTASNAITATTE